MLRQIRHSRYERRLVCYVFEKCRPVVGGNKIEPLKLNWFVLREETFADICSVVLAPQFHAQVGSDMPGSSPTVAAYAPFDPLQLGIGCHAITLL